jgi:hypothetical protein
MDRVYVPALDLYGTVVNRVRWTPPASEQERVSLCIEFPHYWTWVWAEDVEPAAVAAGATEPMEAA